MIHELIVTSVPRGLQAGRSGFTTVLRTRGIHPQLAETLERASGYRHVFPQGDPRNPQIRSHAVVTGATGVVSILSRIGDAGSDYSGRSNKLAHHIALDASETAARASSNPAAVLLALERSGGFQRQWAGEPREQPAGPQVPTVPSEPGACRAWARLAGDAGWAGLLVDRALAKQPTWIIAPQGLDLLELFAEALGLVNYPQRWGITFTTFALSAGDGLWLGTVDGSPEAQSARGQSRVAVVDLVRRAPLTATSPMIEAARGTGPVPWKREAPRTVTAGPAAGLPPMLPTGPIAAGPTSDVLRGVPALPPLLSPAGPPALNGNPPPLAPAQPAAAGGPLLPAGGSWNGAPQRSAGPLLAGMALTFLVVCCAIVFVVVGQLSEPPQPVDTPQPVVEHVVPPKPESEKPVESPPERPPKTPSKPMGPSPEELAAEQERMKAETAHREAEAQKQARKAAFTQLHHRLEQAGHLPLEADVNLQNQHEQMITLCKLDEAEVEVSLPKLPKVNLVPERPWQLQCTAAEGNAWSIAATPYDAAGQPIEIGRVEAKQGELSLTLLPMPIARDPLWVAAREAVTTAPLVLRLPGENSQDFETFVQPCLPKPRDPIELDKLLTDRLWLPKGTKPGKVAGFGTLPGTPWPCRVELEGMGLNEIRGELTSEAPQPLAATPQPTPLKVKAIWTWSGDEAAAKEPFMETTLVMQTNEGAGSPLEIRLEDASILSPWDGPERLGPMSAWKPKASEAEKPRKQSSAIDLLSDTNRSWFESQLPEPKEENPRGPSGKSAPGEAHATKPKPKYPQGTLSKFAEISRRYIPDYSYKQVGQNILGRADTNALTADEWKQKIREKIRASESYKRWVNQVAKAPDGAKPEGKGKEGEQKSWLEKKATHDKYAAAGPDEVEKYWNTLKNDATRHQAEAFEVILCCLHFDLEPMLAEKRLAKKLLEAVDDGTVELSGRLWADPVGDGKFKVLLAEFGEQGEGKPPTPPASPPGQDEKSQPAVSSAK